MGLVGSLVYFLLDLRSIYVSAGDTALLKYIFFCYIVATVLINRIRALMGYGISGVYSLFLGVVVLLFLVGFSGSFGTLTGGASSASPGLALAVNIVIMGLIWLLCDRLTKSCHIDEHDDTMAEGLMSGIAPKKPPEPPKGAKEPADFKDRLPRKHPGSAVVYFSCMALIFFGAGLKLVPAEDAAVRIKTFWCMIVYVFCAFSLLMLTSFSGFRHYFIQRKMAVPGRIAAFWLLFGWAMVILTLIIADIFPQPTAAGPRLTTEVPAIGRARDTAMTLSWSKIKGYASSNQTDEQKGSLKDSQEDRQAAQEAKAPAQSGAAKAEPARPTNMFSGLELPPGLERGVLIICAIIALIVLWVALFAVFRVLGSIGAYRSGTIGVASAFFRRMAEMLGFVRRVKLPQIRIPRKKTLRIKVKDRSKLASPRFKNPFRDPGLKSRLSPQELVRYSYSALIALAQDAGFPRRENQTPYEFAATLPEKLPNLSKPTRDLTEMYVRTEYAEQPVTQQDMATLQTFWRVYESAAGKLFR